MTTQAVKIFVIELFQLAYLLLVPPYGTYQAEVTVSWLSVPKTRSLRSTRKDSLGDAELPRLVIQNRITR